MTFSYFNGLLIGLQDGRVLEPARLHDGEKIDSAPVDSTPLP